ncbi:MAG: hypothetical protein ACYDBH_04365 [Acidobacteriaceae bacterium]
MTLENFTSAQRVLKPRHHVDMGFINHRRILTTFGPGFHHHFEQKRSKGDDHFTRLWNDHLLATYTLSACQQSGVRTLGEILSGPKVGELFCSTEEFLPCPDVYEKTRVVSTLKLPFETDWTVEIEYSTSHICADTGRMVLAEGHKETVVAGIHAIEGNKITAHPLIIGAPSFDHPLNQDLGLDLTWYGWEWYEIHPEDIDEFRGLKDVAIPEAEEWMVTMKAIPEADVKRAICHLLGDPSKKDWGGELNDHFASSAHLSGERVTAAFLLKGPANFEEMTPRHLGKNADQIFRLACAPADILVVQHSHLIGEAVRATLRAFAVNPSSPRRYCCIDGKDTYRLLKAYGRLPNAAANA